MAELFKTSTIWLVDFRYDGRARRRLKAFGANVDGRREVAITLHDLYGKHLQMVEARKATEEEVLQYLRGEEPKNVYSFTPVFSVRLLFFRVQATLPSPA